MPEPDCMISAAMWNFITSGKSHVYRVAQIREMAFCPVGYFNLSHPVHDVGAAGRCSDASRGFKVV